MNTQNISKIDVREDEKSSSFEIDFKKINEKVKEVIEKYGGKAEASDSYLMVSQQPQILKVGESDWFSPVRLNTVRVYHQDILAIGTTGSTYTLSDAIIYSQVLDKAIEIIKEAYDGLENYNKLIAYLQNEEKRAKEEYDSQMKKLVSEFNALPHILKIWTFGNDKVRILLRRGDAEYNPRISSRIRAYINFVLVVNSEEKSFYPSDFISQDNRVLRKKLLRECDYLLRAIQDVNERGKIAEQIADTLLEMQKVREEIYRKYNIHY